MVPGARRWAVIATCFAAIACGSSSGGDLYGPGGPDAAAGTSGSGGSGGGAAGAAGAGAAGGGGLAGAAGATSDAGGGAAGTGASAGADAGSSGGSGGTSGGAGTTGSGGADGGGPAPGAGQIQCGTATCNAATQNCCQSLIGGCQSNFPPLCTGAQVHCDDSNDCNGGVCCATKGLVGAYSARCATTCTGNGDVVLCRASSSCTGGLTCKPFASLSGFDACQP